MKTTTIALAAALLATSATATAQSATDARCLVLSNAFAQQTKDANQQKLAEDTIYFYLGRINGQPTAAQLKTILDQQAKTITNATAGAQMGDCVKAVQKEQDDWVKQHGDAAVGSEEDGAKVTAANKRLTDCATKVLKDAASKPKK